MFAFVAIRVRATFPTLYSQTSPYGHFLYTHASLCLHELQVVHLVSEKPEPVQSLPLYYGHLHITNSPRGPRPEISEFIRSFPI